MSVDLTVASPLNGTPQAVQDQDGNSSGVYLTTTGANLNSNGRLVFGVDHGGGNGEWIQNTQNGQGTGYGISLYADSKEQVRLSNNGNLTIGQASALCNTLMNGDLFVNGAVGFPGLVSGTGSDVVIAANGALGIQTSSARFKENIRELKEDFGKILSLIPVSFTYKDSGQEAIGYTAEELHEKELHHLVSYDEEGKPFSVNYKMLPIYLLEILKQQQEMIGRLEQRLAGALAAG